MLVYGWGTKSKEWQVPSSKEKIRAEWSYFYIAIIYIARTKWFVLNDKRSEDRQVTYEEIKRKFPQLKIPRFPWLPKLSNIIAIALIVFFILVGISKSRETKVNQIEKPIPVSATLSPSSKKAEDFAKAYSLFDNFYCANRRWPTSGQEIVAFAKEQSKSDVISGFQVSQLEASREVQLDIGYRLENEPNNELSMSFIAGFCNTNLPEGQIGLAAGKLSLPVAPIFQSLGTSEIESRYGSSSLTPDYVFINKINEALISIYFSSSEVSMETEEDRQSIRDLLKASYQNSSVGVNWKLATVEDVNSMPAVHLKFESDSTFGRLSNDMYYFLFNGKLLQISLAVPLKNSNEAEKDFALMISNLRITE